MATSNSSSDAKSEVENGEEFKVAVFSSSSEIKGQNSYTPYWGLALKWARADVFGGIILDPAMMVIPIDDHMVHRGHGVFDTAIILDGYLYELDAHLARFLRSASKAKIVSPFSELDLKSILIQLTIASQCKTGTLRYWLSAGPGDFTLSPMGCPSSAFYAVVIDEHFSQCREGVKVITSEIPMKSPLFATMKSVNYLPNVLAQMEAEEKGASGSIWVDGEGYVAEGPNVNVAFVTREKELVLPLFDRVLSGCTALRLLEVAPKLVGPGRLKGVRVGNLTVEEAKGADEMMYVGSTLPILPIIMWDEKPIGDGNVGELTMALSDLLWEDMVSGPETQSLGPTAHTLVVKVVNSNTVLQKGAAASPHLRGTRIAECLIGDETAAILFTARNEQVDMMKPGNTVIIRNAKIDMFKGTMRLAVDKWGRIEVTEPATFVVKEDNNLSLVEYELVTVAQ
ncbi:d-amino-acid transaminase chloroplastic [Phtheirospermum japonicum]|uniref:aminodeoxychorismate lyase n=1 Tax=Phtheirospermum japonicum TaxID=374723 RepID=A0A830B9G0_9LAMI|nr:d-amino-acid transaminase chloroplastic [Phtheirospermum japonicum]